MFKNHLIYDGHANTYAFKYIGPNVALTPLHPPKLLKSKLRKGSGKGLFMRKTQVERAISKSEPLFSLLTVESETTEGVKSMHPLGQLLLRECQDIFPNYLLAGLPSLKEIEDQIDLLSGAPLQYKSAYRSNSNDSKEL